MLIVPGISLKNLNPRFWDKESEYYLPQVSALMVSYAEFHAMPAQRQRAMEEGIHHFLGIERNKVKVYLDNGAFHALTRGWRLKEKEYTEFVEKAKPDWYPVPKDYIPAPSMSTKKQHYYYRRTMEVNRSFQDNGYVPVIHVGRYLNAYLQSIQEDELLSAKPEFGLGGIVPNLLRTPNAPSHGKILANIQSTRASLNGKRIHVFGIGGVSTIHLAALFGMDSVDSSGWRNRAIRGIIQLPGKGDRMVEKLGTWDTRKISKEEKEEIENCKCPNCSTRGIAGLKAKKTEGFSNRAIHNLYVLFHEIKLIEYHLKRGTYAVWYAEHLTNSTYKPLIDRIVSEIV